MKSKSKMSHEYTLVVMKAVYCTVLGRGKCLFPLFGTHEIVSGILSSFWEPLSTVERLDNVSVGSNQGD